MGIGVFLPSAFGLWGSGEGNLLRAEKYLREFLSIACLIEPKPDGASASFAKGGKATEKYNRD